MSATDFISDAPSLATAVSRAFDVYANAPHIGHRPAPGAPYTWRTYGDTGREAASLASGLALPPASLPRRACVAVIADNRPEWIVTDFACALGDYMVIGVHTQWSLDKICAILEEAQVRCCVASEAALPLVLSAKRAGAAVETVVLLGGTEELQQEAEGAGLRACLYEQVVEKGAVVATTHTGFGFGADSAAHLDELDQDSAVYTLMYSSGTSGDPKAVATSKESWRKVYCQPGEIATISSVCDRRVVSYLSLAHGLDRCVQWFTTMAGGTIGYMTASEGSPEFFEELCLLRPCFFVGMSYFWQNLYASHLMKLEPAFTQMVANRLDSTTAQELRSAAPLLWAQLREAWLGTRAGRAAAGQLYEQMRANLGGALLMAVTGGAVTSKDTLEFISHCVTEGNEERVTDSYGSTEFPGIAKSGRISAEAELKLIPVPQSTDGSEETLYSPSDQPHPRGEIVVRRKDGLGSSYWQRPDLVHARWVNGWYHTGDVGLLDYTKPSEDGTPHLSIIDRVNAVEEIYWQGDSVWISPTVLEEVLSALPQVRHCVVTAPDRNRDGLIAIVAVTAATAARHSIDPSEMPPAGSLEALEAVPRALEGELMAAIREAAEARGLKAYQVPVAVVVEMGSWSEPAGQLTLTGKVKRGAVKQMYNQACNFQYGKTEATRNGSQTPTHSQSHTVNLSNCVGSTSRLASPEAAASVPSGVHSRGVALLHSLLAQTQDEVFSAAQHNVAQTLGVSMDQNVPRRGSRIPDLRYTDKEGTQQHPTEAKALQRDWLAGEEPFVFGEVTPIDERGNWLDANWVGTVNPSWEADSTVLLQGPSMGEVELAVGRGDTVKRLLIRTSAALNVPFLQLQLIHRNHLLDHHTLTLDTLGVTPDTPITVVLRPPSSPTLPLSEFELSALSAALEQVRAVALVIREKQPSWLEHRRGRLAAAEARVATALEAMKAESSALLRSFASVWGREMAAAGSADLSGLLFPLQQQEGAVLKRCGTAESYIAKSSPGEAPRPPLLAGLLAVLSSLTRGRLSVLRRQEAVGRVELEPEAKAMFESLNAATTRLRVVGDEVDVDTRMLPLTWTLDLDWVSPPTTQKHCPCPLGCGQQIFVQQANAHIIDGCSSTGVVPDDYEDPEGATQMGGSQAIICEISAAQIASEAMEEFPQDLDGPLSFREPRLHSLATGNNRSPEYHHMLRYLHGALGAAAEADVPGACLGVQVLEQYDSSKHDTWVWDKQHRYWLHKYVKIGKDKGKFDTPASMVTRACSAYAERPVFGIPLAALVPDRVLPRTTPRTALVDAAGAKLGEKDGFGWLLYQDLGRLVARVARGMHSLGLEQGSRVAIAGYNDIEWMVADFGIAVSGHVSVGVHTTYDQKSADAVLDKVECSVLCTMQDLVSYRSPSLWCVEQLDCASLQALVLMDAPACAYSGMYPCSSFVDWLGDSKLDDIALCSPFEARGGQHTMLDGTSEDIFSLLFTSGSSGLPKAVAVGVEAFVHDISGDLSSGEAVSKSLTVSYIPLSHSSDRYKVWEHVVWGGRVAFCFFAAQNWEAHEKEKKSAMIQYVSPIDGLFAQISSVHPTSMSCPPNIWAGLYAKFASARDEYIAAGASEADSVQAAQALIIQLFGGKLNAVATGGAPTPPLHLHFATEVCHHGRCSFVNSYGATECGLVTSNGRQLGPKFAEIQMRLVDRPELGFSSTDKPCPRGEVAVCSPSLALGYLNDPEREAGAFVTVTEDAPREDITPALPPGRWYLTGDLGSVDHTGLLTLLDRVSACCSTSTGLTVRPAELESLLESCPGLGPSLVVAKPSSRLVLAVVHLEGLEHASEGLPEKLEQAVREHRYSDAAKCHAEMTKREGGHADCPQFGAVDVGERALRQLQGSCEWERVVGVVEGSELVLMATEAVWSVENQMLNGEMKKRRGKLLEAYHELIDSVLV